LKGQLRSSPYIGKGGDEEKRLSLIAYEGGDDMPTPKSHEQELCEMFDSYSRRTISNLGMYVRRKYFTHKNRFTSIDPQVLAETEGVDESYPSNSFVVFADELYCELNHEFLYNAFNAMPVNQRKVLILDYWHHWKNTQIADYLGVTVRTVYNLRQRAYQTILLYENRKEQDT
jgi:RNA polymerase sigma factor (sigma-70 family)